MKILDSDAIRPSAYNPRKADKERLELVALSLRKFGWLLPIYADPDGEILSGHQRHHVATSMLGAKRLPVVTTKKMPERRRMAINVLYNRSTNDMQKHDSSQDLREELLSSEDIIKRVQSLPDLRIDHDEWYPVARSKMRPIKELMAVNESWRDPHGIKMANGLSANGLPPMPIVVTPSGKVVNGLARLTLAARDGQTEIECVEIPEKQADLARLLLNRLSMDFNLEERYADLLRWNSFRRAANHQEWLVNVHTSDLLRAGKSKVAIAARAFDHRKPEHVERWKKHYGTTVLDFGAGLLDQVRILNDIGVDAVGFEPFYIGDTRGGDVNPAEARALTEKFLSRVADGTRFESIFLSAVMNSVPFLQDRRHIVTLIAALSTEETSVHAGSVSANHERFFRQTGPSVVCGIDRSSGGFALDYEPRVIIGELSGKPKVQKFHTLAEWRELWAERFDWVVPYDSSGYVCCVAERPKKVPAADLKAAIEFEFDVPYPDGTRMGMVKLAKEAFATRKKVLNS